MKFRDFFSVKHILFAVFIIALMIVLAMCQSNNLISISLESDSISISSTKYSMNIDYSMIESAELTELAEPGEKVADGWDDDLIRAGMWKNDTWGEYYINADLDATNCIVLHLDDGRTFVFSRKDNAETAKIYEQLQDYLNS